MVSRRIVSRFLFVSMAFWLGLGRPSYAVIRETQSMKEVFAEVHSQNSPRLSEGSSSADHHADQHHDTWLVFDIDNTLLEPEGNIGSDQWFYYLFKIYKLAGLSDKSVADKAIDVWNKTQSMIQVKPVEENTPHLIQMAQAQGVRVMALTARSLGVVDRTLEQLHSIGIDFSQAFRQSFGLQEEVMSKKDLQSEDEALFKNGVVFVGENNSKGKVLSYFFQKHGIKPKKLIFVDDRVKHVESVDAAFKDIPHVCFRYGATDAKVSAYNKVMAEVTDKPSVGLFLLGELPSLIQ